MSKKTQAIYGSLEKLFKLRSQLEELNQSQHNAELEQISFEMNQELTALKFWIEALYTYNGKSKSIAKKTSSRENGKKGGRPPKEVTQMRRRISELEEEVIPQLQHDIKFTEDSIEKEKLQWQMEQYVLELSATKDRLENYYAERLV